MTGGDRASGGVASYRACDHHWPNADATCPDCLPAAAAAAVPDPAAPTEDCAGYPSPNGPGCSRCGDDMPHPAAPTNAPSERPSDLGLPGDAPSSVAAPTEGPRIIRHDWPGAAASGGARPAAPTEGAGEVERLRDLVAEFRKRDESATRVITRLRAERDALRGLHADGCIQTVTALRDAMRRIEAALAEHRDDFDAANIGYVHDNLRAALVPPSPGDGEPGE